MKIIELRKISPKQAKKEIKEFFSKHHGETINAADIQEALNIDISLVFEIFNKLEKEGEIKIVRYPDQTATYHGFYGEGESTASN